MKIRITLLMYLLVITRVMMGQDVKEISYEAYLQQSSVLWRKALNLQKDKLKKLPQDETNQLILGIAYYSLLCGGMSTQDETFFDQYVDEAKKLMNAIIKKNPTSGQAKALLSGILGLEISFNPLKGIRLGTKSSSLIKDATNHEPNNALVWRIYGSSKLFTPSAFGGNVKVAIQSLEKSLQLFEADSQAIKNNWLYLDTILLLGQAYERNNEKAKAQATYEKALVIEPNFKYTKKLLGKINH